MSTEATLDWARTSSYIYSVDFFYSYHLSLSSVIGFRVQLIHCCVIVLHLENSYLHLNIYFNSFSNASLYDLLSLPITNHPY